MNTFAALNLNKAMLRAIEDLGFDTPTPIQQEAFPVISSGSDVIGISQTGTGKTFAYMLPLLQQLKFSKEKNPRILILVPTRELVVQVVEQVKSYSAYMTLRVLGVFGESNIKLQRAALADGQDVIVATPGRLYDLIVDRSLQPRDLNKVVIDEVDVMLDLGFRTQLTNLFELLPNKRQNIMFSATMTDDVDDLIEDYFTTPERIAIAVSGTPLENIQQTAYPVKNFLTKARLLNDLISDHQTFHKVLVFVSHKKLADRLFDLVEEAYGSSVCIIHSNKTQNYRLRSVQEFDEGSKRILIATDVIARGLDLDKISHVINYDVPSYPENYMHRIGRTGRAAEQGKTILFFTEKEEAQKEAIESLMDYKIPLLDFPEEVEVTDQLIPEERTRVRESNYNRNTKPKEVVEDAEKLEKNQKVNLGGSYKRKLASKHKKPRTRGDKNQNKKKR
ncbi:DEAD/DEAH box helicase [Reichenbachiella agariperforans]|uniref:ATP-dependent RNA helicase RhlE n=1 Tax=Reichenbachiella agariperforans TaxID=156994 RepID=A0A1M6K6A9_REIAG|nr:DEAD/DEAH box helicase [Reichenbachiella agariperforans]MBU2913434.1 DEAD/DEAH box helicase [Reichenbachiella agariperforans]SHJ54508.1 ATP-dependent RNA helicase RhlE [Reichenbachiella agariperforans]